jgi:hypothetical protein
MGKHKPASARAPHPSNVARDKALREPERKALREQLGDGFAELKGLAGEPVLDLGPTPVDGGSPAQRGLRAVRGVMEGVADVIARKPAHGCVYELGLSSSRSRARARSATTQRLGRDAATQLAAWAAAAEAGEAGGGPSSVAAAGGLVALATSNGVIWCYFGTGPFPDRPLSYFGVGGGGGCHAPHATHRTPVTSASAKPNFVGPARR